MLSHEFADETHCVHCGQLLEACETPHGTGHSLVPLRLEKPLKRQDAAFCSLVLQPHRPIIRKIHGYPDPSRKHVNRGEKN